MNKNKMEQIAGLGAFLRLCFSPVEMHGLICRCYGAHILQPLPPLTLGAQTEFYGRGLKLIQQEAPNQFFFKELRRCRPRHREEIEEMASAAGVGIGEQALVEIPPEPKELAKIRIRDRFSLFSRIKQDLRGDIYSGWDSERSCSVQVFLTPHGDMRKRERCYQDILALSQLPHQNLLQVPDVGVHKGKFYVVSDCPGENPHRLSELEAISCLHQMLSALEAAHNRDIFHGEFHPDHIVLQGEIAQLGGFGFSRLWGQTFSQGEAEDVRELFKFLQTTVEGEPSWLFTLESPEAPIPTSENLKQWLAEFYRPPSVEEEPVESLEEVEPPSMVVESTGEISLFSWFGDPMASITLRNAGGGALPVHIRSEPEWLHVIQEWPDPHRVEQQIDVVFRTNMLEQAEGVGRVLFQGPDGELVEVSVRVKKAYWLWPAVGGVALLLAILAFLVL
jgi:hypothetical protein